MADPTRPLDAPLSHATEAEHRRLIALRANQGITGYSGTFTPEFTFATPGDLSGAYSAQEGIYRRVGGVVYVAVHVSRILTFTTASGSLRIGGLPMAVDEGVDAVILPARLEAAAITFPAGHTDVVAFARDLEDWFEIALQGSGINGQNLTASHISSGNSVGVRISGFYPVA